MRLFTRLIPASAIGFIALALASIGPPLHGQEAFPVPERLVVADADGSLFVVVDQTLRPIAPPQTTDGFLAHAGRPGRATRGPRRRPVVAL